MTKYNPEKRAWKGKSYKKGGRPIKDLRDKEAPLEDEDEAEQGPLRRPLSEA